MICLLNRPRKSNDSIQPQKLVRPHFSRVQSPGVSEAVSGDARGRSVASWSVLRGAGIVGRTAGGEQRGALTARFRFVAFLGVPYQHCLRSLVGGPKAMGCPCQCVENTRHAGS